MATLAPLPASFPIRSTGRLLVRLLLVTFVPKLFRMFLRPAVRIGHHFKVQVGDNAASGVGPQPELNVNFSLGVSLLPEMFNFRPALIQVSAPRQFSSIPAQLPRPSALPSALPPSETPA